MNSAILILPAVGWGHNDITADFKRNLPIWREVPEEFYHEMLNCVPPEKHTGQQFLVGEPYTDQAGDTIYCGLVHVNGKYYGRLVPYRQFEKLALELKSFIREIK